jgi:acylphosphatase
MASEYRQRRARAAPTIDRAMPDQSTSIATGRGPVAETVVRLEIRGRVQGVGFRWAMAEEARRLGVRGWVRNRRDGSVEAVLAGAAAGVDGLVAWARVGPAGAAVTTLDVFPGDGRVRVVRAAADA